MGITFSSSASYAADGRLVLDGIAPLGPYKLLRGVPAVGTPQGFTSVRGKCAPLWITCELHRSDH